MPDSICEHQFEQTLDDRVAGAYVTCAECARTVYAPRYATCWKCDARWCIRCIILEPTVMDYDYNEVWSNGDMHEDPWGDVTEEVTEDDVIEERDADE